MRLVLPALLLLAVSLAEAAPPAPKRVLLLHSFGPDFGDLYAEDLRAELDRELPGRIELYEQWLVSARFTSPQEDDRFVAYLNSLFGDHPLDLIISLGAPAAQFLEQHRDALFPQAPELLADVEERRVPAGTLARNETTVPISVDFPHLVEGILQVLPKTRNLAVIIGNSPIERYWVGQLREELVPLRNRLSVTFLNDLPFDEVLARAARLPAGSAIFYVVLSPSIVGAPEDEDLALAKLHSAADAPIFSYADAYLGEGIVGGPLISGRQQDRVIVSVARRILAGEPASGIRTEPIPLGAPQFDARELKRWHIAESNLPSNSVIRFAEPSLWARYRAQVLWALAIILIQSAFIISLLYERRRRRIAESLARERMGELAHVNRVSALGELSASIAHELRQPLTSILANTEAADLMLKASSPDLPGLKEIVHEIRSDDRRASEVIDRLRGLLVKAPGDVRDIELNATIGEVVKLLLTQAVARRVSFTISFVQPDVRVRADPIQIQQVVLNLIMNAMDAMESSPRGRGTICVRTSLLEDGRLVEVAIEDSGPGIPAGGETAIFEPFVTTKKEGMGMGLSIARTIIQTHGGMLRAENAQNGGAVFRFTLQVSNAPVGIGGRPVIGETRPLPS